jgi:hypothetical protein
VAEVAGFLGADDVAGFVCETAPSDVSAMTAIISLRM